IKVTTAGRTDAGVHATGQVVSFVADRAFPIERLTLALNASLPDDLTVREAANVAERFSARFSALERTYVYLVWNHAVPSALLARYAYHVYGALDLDRMAEAAHGLIGEHDFRSFCGMLPESGPTIRTVRAITMRRSGDLVVLLLRADGFLHRMVRNIVGTVLEIGNGRRDVASIGPTLAARSRTEAGHTAPAHGLYLAGVTYPDYDSFKAPPPAYDAM
ncbi:MAG: tRNA pseudouridine(38-40) synthase TruA, partial [Candidatus Eremiobacteraeota bacterium]|nr:tRNA pseudouridine(38-40) synthase TruA [Candidatus Eremiobacteraeota bacterium]